MNQPFDDQGNLLCPVCNDIIGPDDFYLEVRQRNPDQVDEDAKLAVHVGCSGQLSWRKLRD